MSLQSDLGFKSKSVSGFIPNFLGISKFETSTTEGWKVVFFSELILVLLPFPKILLTSERNMFFVFFLVGLDQQLAGFLYISTETMASTVTRFNHRSADPRNLFKRLHPVVRDMMDKMPGMKKDSWKKLDETSTPLKVKTAAEN